MALRLRIDRGDEEGMGLGQTGEGCGGEVWERQLLVMKHGG